MQVDDQLLRCVAFVGPVAGDGAFYADGTGFFVYVEIDEHIFAYFVTAAHLVWPKRHRMEKPATAPAIRINTSNGGFQVVRTEIEDWIFPDDHTIDMCVVSFDL